MRVICMVPSLTESLLECGVQVVGRTRFCVHPAETVSKIPIVGGTKDIDWAKVRSLSADLLILDQEENPKHFAEESPLRWVATHIRSVADLARDLRNLARVCACPALNEWAARAEDLLTKPTPKLQTWPGQIELLDSFDPHEKSANKNDALIASEVVYVIWKKPWMAAGSNTYIGSVLRLLGLKMKALPEGPYPAISEEMLRSSVGLFSSEPFPFAKKVDELKAEGFRGAIVDGEGYSWFGVRGIRFLEDVFSSHH